MLLLLRYGSNLTQGDASSLGSSETHRHPSIQGDAPNPAFRQDCFVPGDAYLKIPCHLYPAPLSTQDPHSTSVGTHSAPSPSNGLHTDSGPCMTIRRSLSKRKRKRKLHVKLNKSSCTCFSQATAHVMFIHYSRISRTLRLNIAVACSVSCNPTTFHQAGRHLFVAPPPPPGK
jgi:hypothetical protein